MEPLRVSLVQSGLAWENREANLEHFTRKLAALKGKTDLVVLPEMFNTGFTAPGPGIFENMNGPTIKWLRQQSRDIGAVITGSLIIKAGGKFYNRLVWVEPWDITGTYDKRHLFRMAGEHQQFTAGKSRLIKDLKGWRICPLICYDLRFPVWSRNQNDYDVLIYIANWPKPRRNAWQVLLQARAIENQCYVVGVNRVGLDGNDIEYAGDSAAIDPRGNLLTDIPENREHIETVALDYDQLASFRKNFPVGLDSDEFSITD